MWLIVEETNVPNSCAAAFQLAEGDFSVGRQLDCDLVLTGRRVSRHHLVISRKGNEVTFAESEDAVGTQLNGEFTSSGKIVSGAKLTIGNTVLRFESEKNWTESVQQKPKEKAAALSMGQSGQEVTWEPFQAFLDTLREAVDPRVMLKRLLLGLVDIFGAERGFVMLRQGKTAKLIPVAEHQLDDSKTFIEISTTVYKEALDKSKTVFIKNSFQDERCAVAKSIVAAPAPRTIVCGPLAVDGQNFGVIYIDMPLSISNEYESKLPLFESITGLTSRLLAAGQTRQSLLTANGRIEALNTLAWEGKRLVMGDGPASQELRTLLATAAQQDVNVLITGDTGTGKEMVARAIHRMSARRDGPFVPVNCAALPRDIIEAELFGAEKGAFTGAAERRLGRFELASTGTLFLDELGELPLDIQVKLLRSLQERVITRLGGSDPVPVDFRLICATNVDLEEAVRAGTFRKDMYYRINVFRVRLRPLRERKDEIAVLAKHFIEEFSGKFGRPVKALAPEAERLIQTYDWPGNVRELRNAIERAVLLEQASQIEPSSLPIASSSAPTQDDLERAFTQNLPDDYETAREVFERAFLKRMIEKHEGNVTAAAKAAGMPRSTVYRRLGKLGLLKQED